MPVYLKLLAFLTSALGRCRWWDSRCCCFDLDRTLGDPYSQYRRGSEERNCSARAGNRTPVLQSTPTYFLSRPNFKCVYTVLIGRRIFAVVLTAVVYPSEYQTGMALMRKSTLWWRDVRLGIRSRASRQVLASSSRWLVSCSGKWFLGCFLFCRVKSTPVPVVVWSWGVWF